MGNKASTGDAAAVVGDDYFVTLTGVEARCLTAERLVKEDKKLLAKSTYVLYRVDCGFEGQSWSFQVRYRDVQRLDDIVAPLADEGLPEPSREWRFSEPKSRLMERRRLEVDRYLRRVAGTPELWALPEVREFFEVSSSSFVHDLGPKAKEGYVMKSSRSVDGVTQKFTRFNRRWLVLKDSYVAYYASPEDDVHQPRGVHLVDPSLRILPSSRDRGRSEFIIACGDREVLIRISGRNAPRRAQEWRAAFEVMYLSKPRRVEPRVFGSFTPWRSVAPACAYVCGRELMGAVAMALQAARKEIFIAAWHLLPEVLLTRHPDPPIVLADILKQKAEAGVRIHILLFRETADAREGRSVGQRLRALHPSIQVLRHPKTLLGSAPWAHHEKLVVVDQAVAFVGGMDLAEGRFDDFLHRLSDLGLDQCPVAPPPVVAPVFLPAEETKTDALAPVEAVGSPSAPPEDGHALPFASVPPGMDMDDSGAHAVGSALVAGIVVAGDVVSSNVVPGNVVPGNVVPGNVALDAEVLSAEVLIAADETLHEAAPPSPGNAVASAEAPERAPLSIVVNGAADVGDDAAVQLMIAVAEAAPCAADEQIWPGKEYYNPNASQKIAARQQGWGSATAAEVAVAEDALEAPRAPEAPWATEASPGMLLPTGNAAVDGAMDATMASTLTSVPEDDDARDAALAGDLLNSQPSAPIDTDDEEEEDEDAEMTDPRARPVRGALVDAGVSESKATDGDEPRTRGPLSQVSPSAPALDADAGAAEASGSAHEAPLMGTNGSAASMLENPARWPAVPSALPSASALPLAPSTTQSAAGRVRAAEAVDGDDGEPQVEAELVLFSGRDGQWDARSDDLGPQAGAELAEGEASTAATSAVLSPGDDATSSAPTTATVEDDDVPGVTRVVAVKGEEEPEAVRRKTAGGVVFGDNDLAEGKSPSVGGGTDAATEAKGVAAVPESKSTRLTDAFSNLFARRSDSNEGAADRGTDRVLSREVVPRMPWHDVSVGVGDAAARDVAFHFIQRWNHHRLALNKDVAPLLPFSDSPEACRLFAMQEHVRQMDQRLPRSLGALPLPWEGGGCDHCDIQMLRSAGPWSLGVEPEVSIHTAWSEAISGANHLVYMEQQTFITCFEGPDEAMASPWVRPASSPEKRAGASFMKRAAAAAAATVNGARALLGPKSLHSGVENMIGAALLGRLRRAIRNQERFRVAIVLPLHPDGKFLKSAEAQATMQLQFETLCRGSSSLLGRLREEFPEVKLSDYIGLFSLRSHDELPIGPVSEQVGVHSGLLLVDDRLVVVGSAGLSDRSLAGDRNSEVACILHPQVETMSTMGGEPFDAGSLAHALRVRLWREHLGFLPRLDPQLQAYASEFLSEPQHRYGSDAREVELFTARRVRGEPAAPGTIPAPRNEVEMFEQLRDPVCDETWAYLCEVADQNTALLERAFDGAAWNDVRSLDEARARIGLSGGSVRVTAPPGSPAWAAQVNEVRTNLAGVRGRLVRFPERFLEGANLEPGLLRQLLGDPRAYQ